MKKRFLMLGERNGGKIEKNESYDLSTFAGMLLEKIAKNDDELDNVLWAYGEGSYNRLKDNLTLALNQLIDEDDDKKVK